MTTNPETPRLVVAGNGTRGPFTLSVSGTPITYAAASELVLKRYESDGDLEATLVNATDYALSAASVETGAAAATFTLDASEAVLAVGESIVVERVTAKSSNFTLATTGGIFEAALDKLTRLIQELSTAIDRRLRAHPLYTGSAELPVAEASALLGWNASATALINYEGTTDVGVSTAMAPVVQAATTGEAAREGSFAYRMTNLAALQAATWASADAPQYVALEYNYTAGDPGGVFRLDATDTSSADNGGTVILTSTSGGALRYKRIYDRLNLRFWNVRNDGVAFTYSAFAAALTYASAAGERLHIPAGRYRHDTAAGTLTLENVIIEGEGVLDGATPHYDKGTVLEIVGTATSPFTVKRGGGVVGCAFYYPNVTDTLTPTTYASTLNFDFSAGAVQFVLVQRCAVFNAFDFILIDDASGNVGHVKIEGNYIFAFRKSISILNNLENIEIHDNVFTFGHWTDANDTAKSQKYYRENGIAIEYLDGDGCWLDSNLFFGMKYGLLNQGGSAIQIAINGNAFDQVLYPIYASSPSGSLGAVQVSGNIMLAFNDTDAALTGAAITLLNTAAEDKITIVGNHFGQCRGSQVVIDGTSAGSVNLNGNTYELAGYQLAAGSHASIALNCANKIVHSDGEVFLGASSAFVNGLNVSACSVLKLIGATFKNLNRPVNVSACGAYVAAGCSSSGTVDTTSNVVSGVTGEARETACVWDKPAYVSTYPRFSASMGTATYNAAGPTDIVFGTETFDDGGDYNNATGVFTAPAPGRYEFRWQLFHDNTITATDRWTITLQASAGAAPIWTYRPPAADYNSIAGHAALTLAAGATVKLTITRNVGAGNFVLLNDGNANRFSGNLID